MMKVIALNINPLVVPMGDAINQMCAKLELEDDDIVAVCPAGPANVQQQPTAGPDGQPVPTGPPLFTTYWIFIKDRNIKIQDPLKLQQDFRLQ